MSEFNFDQFRKDRDAAFLSLDRDQIISFLTKYGEVPHPNEDIFWAGVHKARTAAKSLPMEARIESKRWLTACGLSSMDDGDVPDQIAPSAGDEREGATTK